MWSQAKAIGHQPCLESDSDFKLATITRFDYLIRSSYEFNLGKYKNLKAYTTTNWDGISLPKKIVDFV